MGRSLTVKKDPGKRHITGGKSLSQLGDQIRDLKSKVPELIPIDSIPIMKEFQDLFPMKQQNREAIAKSIQENGFDPKKAILIGSFPNGTRSLVDGYTRRASSLDAGKTEIFAWDQEFESIEAAIDWALHEQINRRNLSDAEIYDFVLRVDQIKDKGRKENQYKGRSSQKTAEIVGTNSRHVERIRAVEKNASDEQKHAIKMGTKTVYKVSQELKESAPNGGNSLVVDNSRKTPRNWDLKIKGASIVLIKNEKAQELVVFNSLKQLYGAPSQQIKKVVQKYLETIL